MTYGGLFGDEEERIQSPEEIAAELEEARRKLESLKADRQRAMNTAKRIVLAHFPRLQHVELGEKVCYNFSSLSAKRTMEEVDMLQPSPPVDMLDVR